METLSEFERDNVSIRVSRTELIALANALNEARESVDAWEFELRMGVKPEVAEAIHSQIRSLLAR